MEYPGNRTLSNRTCGGPGKEGEQQQDIKVAFIPRPPVSIFQETYLQHSPYKKENGAHRKFVAFLRYY